tara:strand:+ start:177471 stop:177965 length:495 start_codon:yes stop_codon:yes gene_type:complete
MNRAGLVLLAALFSLPVAADDGRWLLVGEAQLKVLFWPVYNSRLYSADGEYLEGQRPLRLEIQYLRDVAAADLVENTQSEWDRLPAASLKSEQWLQTLAQIWPDVGVDDVLELQVDEAGRSAFLMNSQPLGGIDDPDFGKHFLNIWLSPDTSRPELRLALIGRD